MFTQRSRTDQVIQDARKLAEDIRLLASDASKETQRGMDVATERAAEAYHQAEQSVRRKAHEVDVLAHERPWVAVGLAAAIGALVGALLTRRR